jgi:hypothetical protein
MFSYFALTDPLSAVPRASSLIFRSRTHFRRYRQRHVQFSLTALPHPFSAVPRAPGLVFLFYSSDLIIIRTEGVGSNFNDLRSQTRFRRYPRCRVQFL